LINPNDDVELLAFFLDTYAGDPKRGSYTLTIEETGQQAAAEHTIRAGFDGIIVNKKVLVTDHRMIFLDKPRSEATKNAASPAGNDGEARYRTNPKP
jgi:hypothetical protein